MPNVLTIAGTDPSSAAGIQADLQVFRDFDVYGLSVVTAVIAQNTCGVGDWVAVEPHLLERQIHAVLTDIEVDAIKIGVVPTASAVHTIVKALTGRRLPIVVDPVLASGSGHTALVREGTAEALVDYVFPLATIVTPNALEAATLLGRMPREDLDVDDLAELAVGLQTTGVEAVLVKGGHATGSQAIDVLATADGVFALKAYERIPDDVRGTGCQLSSAIAARLAFGDDLVTAVESARAYLASLLQERRGRLGKGRLVVRRDAKQ